MTNAGREFLSQSGIRLRILFPLLVQLPNARRIIAAQIKSKGWTMHTQTILIADDEAGVRALIEATLGNENCRVLQAENGFAAFEVARRELPDLIILDWRMPGYTGPEVAERLRADASTANIPIVLLTGISNEQDRRRALGAGALAYLVKPFSPLQLLQVVQQLLARRMEAHENGRSPAGLYSGTA
jgi:CheY-like chemotaxis protein